MDFVSCHDCYYFMLTTGEKSVPSLQSSEAESNTADNFATFQVFHIDILKQVWMFWKFRDQKVWSPLLDLHLTSVFLELNMEFHLIRLSLDIVPTFILAGNDLDNSFQECNTQVRSLVKQKSGGKVYNYYNILK